MRVVVIFLSVVLSPTVLEAGSGAAIREGAMAGEEWVSPRGMRFCWCPAGGPVKTGYWMGKFEVTRSQFDEVTKKRPKGELATLPNHPKDSVRHDDVELFLEQLNLRERFQKRLPEGWLYVLPSRKEWEYACRAGSDSKFYFGDDEKDLGRYANFADRTLLETKENYFHYALSSSSDGVAFLSPVGRFKPNSWGLHDMAGNLWEWTSDREGESAVVCGGSWASLPEYCQSDSFRKYPIDAQKSYLGFRIVLKKVE